MKKLFFLILALVLTAQYSIGQNPRKVINLDGTWEFDQTINAFPPDKFTRSIPVPD